jgi:hypothetical protein
VTVHDEQAISPFGQLAAHAQVAHHNLECHIGTHRHRVGIHQPAGSVLGIGEYRGQAHAILLVHRAQHLACHRFRQFGQQVGQVVDGEALGRGDQLLWLHFINQLAAYFLGELDQYVAIEIAIDQFPDESALRWRQRFEQQCDLGWMQRIDHAVGAAQPAVRDQGLDCGESRTAIAARLLRGRHFGKAL